MPLSTQSQGDEELSLFIASLDRVRHLSNVLKAMPFKKNAVFTISSNGMKVTVEDFKCYQANAFIQADIFQEFTLKEDRVIFQLNLTILLECLNIFGEKHSGQSAAMRMSYRGYGYPLTVLLEENRAVTICKINTQEPEEPIDFDFDGENIINKAILQSSSLKSVFSGLDTTSEVLQVTISPCHPFFRLSTFGNYRSSYYDYPKDSDIMEVFKSTKTQTTSYKMSLLKQATKAMSLSSKVSWRIDNRGILSLQFLFRNDNGQMCFVEYFCCPNVELDD